ncbi:MAG: hypothetical protein DRR42_23595, partial [Gammaproteobacteria bacterium]
MKWKTIKVMHTGLLFAALLTIGVRVETAQSADSDIVQEVGVPATPVTITAAESRNLEVWEESVGQLEPKVAPLIAAEVSGRLTVVNVDVG